MGTNFYIRGDTAEMHIGKRSMGWQFGFRAWPTIRSRADWEKVVAQVGEVIDENGVTYTPEEFWEAVDTTRQPRPNGAPARTREHRSEDPSHPLYADSFTDDAGWDFTSREFC